MASMRESAVSFLDACETGKGWEACRQYCVENATFSAQAASLQDIHTLQAYTEWMKGLFTPIPDGRYEVRTFAVDDEQRHAVVYAVFSGTHSGAGGPLPPTGKQVESDYVYMMEFDGDRVRHMTKIWNDGFALKQLGWV